MQAYFEKAFGSVLEKIKNPEYRKKAIECWVMAAKEGGWTSGEELEQIPFTLLTDTCGLNLIEHTIAVTLGAEGLAQSQMNTYHDMPYEIDMDILYVGGLLHDVGKLLEFEKTADGYRKSHSGKCTRHPISGAILAAKLNLPDEMINTIANHAKEGDGRPKRIETILIHQADFATFDPLVMKQKGILIE